MPHPLDDVRARLGRTDENILNMEREIIDFWRQHPNLVHSHLDPKTGDYSTKVGHTPAPARLSVLCGEILFLLRSSLDHIVTQLLIPITPPADLDGVLKRSSFPTYTDLKSWQAFDWTKIPDVSQDVRTAITSYQPCNRTDGLPPEDHSLAILSSLNNIDKHRNLLVLTNRTTARHRVHVEGNVYIKELRIDANAASTGLDTELVRGTVVPVTPEGLMNVDTQVTVEIAFKEFGTVKAEPVVPALQALLKCVTALTDDFQTRFFP